MWIACGRFNSAKRAKNAARVYSPARTSLYKERRRDTFEKERKRHTTEEMTNNIKTKKKKDKQHFTHNTSLQHTVSHTHQSIIPLHSGFLIDSRTFPATHLQRKITRTTRVHSRKDSRKNVPTSLAMVENGIQKEPRNTVMDVPS
jgi:uncharacterized protein YyaL (SSP411 family)